MYCLFSPPSFFLTSRSPNRTLRRSSLALQPKCIVLLSLTVQIRASGQWLPSCFVDQSFSMSSSFNPSVLFGRRPFPCWRNCLRLDSRVALDFANSLSLNRLRLSKITQMAAKTLLEERERTWLELGAVLLSYIYEKVAEKPA